MSAEAQLRVLIDMGYSLEDAQNSIGWVAKNAPSSLQAFTTWIPSPTQLADMADNEMTQDARVAWYNSAPRKFQRILDATDR